MKLYIVDQVVFPSVESASLELNWPLAGSLWYIRGAEGEPGGASVSLLTQR